MICACISTLLLYRTRIDDERRTPAKATRLKDLDFTRLSVSAPLMGTTKEETYLFTVS